MFDHSEDCREPGGQLPPGRRSLSQQPKTTAQTSGPIIDRDDLYAWLIFVFPVARVKPPRR